MLQIVSGIEHLSSDAQIICLGVLAARKGAATAVASVVERLIKSPDDRVVLAAIETLRAIGGPKSMRLLLELTENARSAGAATAALERVESAGMEDYLLEYVADTGNPQKRRAAAITALAKRNVTKAVPVLLECVGGPSASVQASAMKALTVLASTEHVVVLDD